MSIEELTPAQLRKFIQDHHEKTYALIDVRQPGEYEYGHIPGARLMPLPALVQDMTALPRDKAVIFYCRSGARSMAAAAMVEDEQIVQAALYNLAGGMLAWDGAVAAGHPRVQLFNTFGAPAEMLATAMNLEKGALNFYTQVRDRYQQEPWVAVFATLAQAEIGHAKTVYQFLSQLEPDGAAFDDRFSRLSGDVLEGGMTLEAALAKAADIRSRACLGLIELALQIEYAAFDLYRSMADLTISPDARESFLTLAQAEKSHMQVLAKVVGDCT
jgi:sulfur-carrier protein adenylyltransferase/sulfurtransferase